MRVVKIVFFPFFIQTIKERRHQMHFFSIERYENKNVLICKLQYLMAIKHKSVCIKHLR